MFKITFTAIGLCLAASLLMGQSEDRVTVQFVSFPILSGAEPIELLLGGEETMEVELPTNSLSPEYKVDRMTEWALGISSTNSEGDFFFQSYGRAKSLSSPKQLILVLRKGKNDSDGLSLIPMDSQLTNFGGGSYILMNAAMVDIAVEIGKDTVILNPKQHKLVKPEPSRTEGDRKFLYVYLHFRKGKEAVPFYSGTWRFSEMARSFVFIYHDPHTKQLRTHSIRNYIDT